jgi:hypothetical protein
MRVSIGGIAAVRVSVARQLGSTWPNSGLLTPFKSPIYVKVAYCRFARHPLTDWNSFEEHPLQEGRKQNTSGYRLPLNKPFQEGPDAVKGVIKSWRSYLEPAEIRDGFHRKPNSSALSGLDNRHTLQ